MSIYNPDRWVIVKITNPKTVIHKVLGSWSGGYLDSDNWRMSSGLEKIEEEGDYFLMHSYSGSIYKCHKDGNGLTTLRSSIYNNIEKQIEIAGEGYKVETISVEEFEEGQK